MAEVSAELVKQLRAKTGAGMMDCKVALSEAKGDMEGAVEVLRKKGLKDLGKRGSKVAAEGAIGVYVHPGDQVVAIVELNCETDFVARGDDFRTLARDIAMHVAASRPIYLSRADVPPSLIQKEEEILMEQLTDKQKEMADKILPGRMAKFFEETVLLDQIFVKDDSGKKTIQGLLEDLAIKCGEKLQVRKFQRFEVGEGVEKTSSDFASEVSSMIQN